MGPRALENPSLNSALPTKPRHCLLYVAFAWHTFTPGIHGLSRACLLTDLTKNVPRRIPPRPNSPTASPRLGGSGCRNSLRPRFRYSVRKSPESTPPSPTHVSDVARSRQVGFAYRKGLPSWARLANPTPRAWKLASLASRPPTCLDGHQEGVLWCARKRKYQYVSIFLVLFHCLSLPLYISSQGNQQAASCGEQWV